MGKNYTTVKHKKYGNKHISFMVMSDPTKPGKTVKVPLWIRYPFYTFIIAVAASVLFIAFKITSLEAVIADQRLEIYTNEYTINEREQEILDLTMENEQHYNEFVELKDKTDELITRLESVEFYKDELDQKVNSTEKTTETKPISYGIQRDEIDHMELKTSSLRNETLESDISTFDMQLDKLELLLNESISMIDYDQEDLQILDAQLEEIIPYWDAYPNIYPVKDTYVSSAFGYRRDPITYVTDFHTGVDLAARYTSVYATGEGEVILARYTSGYGYNIIIDHGYGIRTRYAHLSDILVSVGDKVVRGDEIAISGSSGRSTGPHLHYEVIKDGEFQNPIDYINEGE